MFITKWLRHQHPENFYPNKTAAFIGGVCTAYVLGWVVPKAIRESKIK